MAPAWWSTPSLGMERCRGDGDKWQEMQRLIGLKRGNLSSELDRKKMELGPAKKVEIQVANGIFGGFGQQKW